MLSNHFSQTFSLSVGVIEMYHGTPRFKIAKIVTGISGAIARSLDESANECRPQILPLKDCQPYGIIAQNARQGSAEKTKVSPQI